MASIASSALSAALADSTVFDDTVPGSGRGDALSKVDCALRG
jgi:hypothetical protein